MYGKIQGFSGLFLKEAAETPKGADHWVPKIEDLIKKYDGAAKIASDETRKGVRTLVIGVNNEWHKALIGNLERMKFAKKGDTYALQVNGSSIMANGFDQTIVIRLTA